MLSWYFPPTGGGIEQDFHHPGQEAFKARGAWNNIIREIIQNSLDASATNTKPVHVDIELNKVPTSAIGPIDLSIHIEAVFEGAIKHQQEEAIQIYEHALNILKEPNIDVLSIIDSNTTGLQQKNLNALVYREGASEKTGNAGGSYGIGKHAPFIVSAIKTVFYSTTYTNPKKTEQCIGKSILSAHDNPKGAKLQHVGFGTNIPTKDGCQPRPMIGSDIYKDFRLKNTGTGVFILGFTPPTKQWKRGAIQSIAKNFFDAIHNEKLTVTVCGEQIVKNTLSSLLDNAGDTQKSHWYYKTIKKPDGVKTIEVNEIRFDIKYIINRDDLPNRIAYLNRMGMLITDSKQKGSNPFAVTFGSYLKYVAVVQANDDETDQLIRKMEPPSHKSIDPDRIISEKIRNNYKANLKDANKQIEKILRDVIGEGMKGEIIYANETIDFFPIKMTGGQKEGRNNENQLKIVKMPHPKEYGMGRGIGGTEESKEDDSTVSESTKKSTGRNSGAGSVGSITRAGRSYIVRRRSVRSNDRLRISFDNTAESYIKLKIRFAGEQRQGEKNIPITDARILSPPDHVEDVHKDGWLTIPPSRNRMVVEIGIPPNSEYSGYEIIEKMVKDGESTNEETE